ncbi:MAG TPA: acyltransferase family protein [Anaeromyxobacter sp.]|nr:acyltransferase family protein [Anaeromyxobacter sp.]
MQRALELASPPARSTLGLLEQTWRDARLRVSAASGVVLVHCAYPPGDPVLSRAPPDVATWEAILFRVVVSIPVNAFILLAFVGMAARLSAGAPPGRLLRTSAQRLVPAHAFWVVAFLAARAAQTGQLPSPRAVAEGLLLGTAAAHLYFTPLLLALMAAVPAVARRAGSPARVALLAIAVAAITAALEQTVGRDGLVLRTALGILGYVPYALAGLALGGWWGGIAPGPERARIVAPIAAAVAAAAAAAILWLGAAPGGAALRPSPALWLAGNGLGLSVPVLLLCAGGRPSLRVARLAALSMGVYFVHPFFVVGLRMAEARLPALRGQEVWMILPNAAAAAVLSFLAVRLMSRTRLRRVVG